MGVGKVNDSSRNRERKGGLGLELEAGAGGQFFGEIEFQFPFKEDHAIATIIVSLLKTNAFTSGLGFATSFISYMHDINIDPWAYISKYVHGRSGQVSLTTSINLLSTKNNPNNVDPDQIDSHWNNGSNATASQKQTAFDPQNVLTETHQILGLQAGWAKVFKVEVVYKYRSMDAAYDETTGERCPYETQTTRFYESSKYSQISTDAFSNGNLPFGLVDFAGFSDEGSGYALKTIETFTTTDTDKDYLKKPTVTLVKENFTRMTFKDLNDQLLGENTISIAIKDSNTVPKSKSAFVNSIVSLALKRQLGKAGRAADWVLNVNNMSGSMHDSITISLVAEVEKYPKVKELISEIVNVVVAEPSGLTTDEEYINHFKEYYAYIYTLLLSPLPDNIEHRDNWIKWQKRFSDYLILDGASGIQVGSSFGFSIETDLKPDTDKSDAEKSTNRYRLIRTFKKGLKLLKFDLTVGMNIFQVTDYRGYPDWNVIWQNINDGNNYQPSGYSELEKFLNENFFFDSQSENAPTNVTNSSLGIINQSVLSKTNVNALIDKVNQKTGQ